MAAELTQALDSMKESSSLISLSSKERKTTTENLSDTKGSFTVVANSLSSLDASLLRIENILLDALAEKSRQRYAEEETAMESQSKPAISALQTPDEEGGATFTDALKSLLTNPAVIAAFSGLVYLFLPKDIKEKISAFFGGFLEGATSVEEPLSNLQIALAGAGAGLATYLGASVLQSISEAISSTMTLITKAKGAFGKLKGKKIGNLLKGGAAAIAAKPAIAAGAMVGTGTAIALTASGGGEGGGAAPASAGGAQAVSLPPIAGSGGGGGGGAPGSADDPMNADLGQFVVKKDSGVDLEGLDPNLKKRLAGMAKEYYEKTGKKIQINSAFRDPKEQAELYRTIGPPKAAPPGRSRHEKGTAFDMNSGDASTAIQLGLFDKYGFTRPVKGETWHVEPVENRGGVFADNPVSPGAPVVVASAKGAVIPGSGEKVPESVSKPPAVTPVSSTETGGVPDWISGMVAAAKEASANAPKPTEKDIQEAERIQAESGDPEAITPEQVASNRAINEGLTGAASKMLGVDLSKASEQVAAAETPAEPTVINNNQNNSQRLSEKEGPDAPPSIPSPIANRGSLGMGVKHHTSLIT